MTKDINRLIQNPIGRLKRIVFCLCIAMAAFFSSCTNDACKESMYTSMQVLLYSKGTPTQATSLDTLSIIAMRNGLPVDTIYKDTSGVSVWELPLITRLASPNSIFVVIRCVILWWFAIQTRMSLCLQSVVLVW